MAAHVSEFASSHTITMPDDWHLHLRDGEHLKAIVGYTSRQFRRALVMPNLKPPVTTVQMAGAYRERILAALPDGSKFFPFMTLYLTDNTDPKEIPIAKASGFVKAVKYYPAGATTNSDSGVTDIEKVYPVLERMEELGVVLCVHGEVTWPDEDVFDREKAFIDIVLSEIVRRFPKLRIVVEHVTTKDAADFVKEASKYIAATITAQHLLFNRNAIFTGGIRPHYYCLPILKRGRPHQAALIAAATAGNPKFFAGTDSAPHARNTKEAECGCAGCFTAVAAVEKYAAAFDRAGKMEKLEAFMSFNGADFYELPRNTEQITLVKQEQRLPSELPYGRDTIVPLMAGETLPWSVLY